MMNKEELLDFIAYYRISRGWYPRKTDSVIIEDWLKFNLSSPQDKTPKVITNEKAKEVCCSTCRYARGYSCTNSQTCKGDYEFWEQ